jgi:DNA-binding response OmpR family regulator
MNQNSPRILYVEDDLYLSYVTRDNLQLKGYNIVFCKNGIEAFQAFQQQKCDLCILDVMLPEMDGFTLAGKIRQADQDIPIIFLSAKSLKEDRIEGFMAGGDDYITKPFSIEELVLKIEVFLKRSRITIDDKTSKPSIVSLGKYFFDPGNLTLTFQTESKRLTTMEAGLLNYFSNNRNKILKKEDILREVWENDSYLNSRSLDVFVSRLRKYLHKDPGVKINNVHGLGFILSVKDI